MSAATRLLRLSHFAATKSDLVVAATTKMQTARCYCSTTPDCSVHHTVRFVSCGFLRGVNEYDDSVLTKLEQVDKKAYWSAKGENALRKR
jgi:hypothetical protein